MAKILTEARDNVDRFCKPIELPTPNGRATFRSRLAKSRIFLHGSLKILHAIGKKTGL
jgi:hypothetical protein